MTRFLAATLPLLFLLVAAPAVAGGGHGRGKAPHGAEHAWVEPGAGVGHHDNGLHRGWHKGERLPVVYLEPRYVIHDYHAYHLAAPRPGYHWVRVPDGRFILVAIATGVIADILLGH